MKFLSILVFCSFIFFACHASHCHPAENQNVNILASTFPVYLFTKNICADVPNINVDLLIPASAGCPHDFALRPGDMAKLAKADILVINGDGLEEFLHKFIKSVEHKIKIIDAGENVPAIESDDDHGHGAINPHIFAAPAQAAIMVENIANKLSEYNFVNKSLYEANGKKYQDKLIRLSSKFADIGKRSTNKKIALGHDALAYLAQNAGLEIIAIFENADSVAKLNSLKKLLEKEKPALLAGDSQYPDRLLQTLAKETNLPAVVLNPCAGGPENPPLDYYEKEMEMNLKDLEAYFD